MGGNVFMLVCILTLCMCLSVLGVEKNGILHEPITLPCSLSCNGLITWTLEDTGTVIKCKNGFCETGKGFENRFNISNEVFDGKRSRDLTISSLKYNDRGIYSCNCDGHLCGHYKLVVLVPFDVDVSIGNNVSLPCHAAIKKNIEYETVSVWWEKYGEEKWEEVLRLEKGHFSYGPMEDRVSVPEDGYKNGDLSLNITDARLSDQGVYRCRYSPTRDAGVPGSVRLNVKEKTWSCVIESLMTLLTTVVLILGSFGCYKFKGIPKRFRRQSVAKASVPEENVDSESISMMNLKTDSTVRPMD